MITIVTITVLVIVGILAALWMVLKHKGSLEMLMDLKKGTLNVKKNK